MPQKLLTRLKYAKPKDAQDLSDLFRASWHGAYRGIIPYQELDAIIRRRNTKWWTNALTSNQNIILISFNDVPIGYASIGRLRTSNPQIQRIKTHTKKNQQSGELLELYLTPDYQGLGFGRQLFQAACNELRKRGMQKLFVWALSKNTNACEFYRHLGGETITSKEERFGNSMLAKTGFTWTL